MNNTNKLGIKSPHDTNHKLSPFPIRNVNATANKKTEAYCKSFLFEFIVVIFKVNAARKSKVDDNTARMQSIKQLGV